MTREERAAVLRRVAARVERGEPLAADDVAVLRELVIECPIGIAGMNFVTNR